MAGAAFIGLVGGADVDADHAAASFEYEFSGAVAAWGNRQGSMGRREQEKPDCAA